jgi:hypothetical protein
VRVPSEYSEAIRRRLEIPPVEGPDKVTTLAEAVRRHVAPGEVLYIGTAHARA